MAKKITGYVKLQVPAGAANPSPPIGPALGQRTAGGAPPSGARPDRLRPRAGGAADGRRTRLPGRQRRAAGRRAGAGAVAQEPGPPGGREHRHGGHGDPHPRGPDPAGKRHLRGRGAPDDPAGGTLAAACRHRVARVDDEVDREVLFLLVEAHEEAIEAMRLASHKLPVATRVVTRENAPTEATDGHR